MVRKVSLPYLENRFSHPDRVILRKDRETCSFCRHGEKVSVQGNSKNVKTTRNRFTPSGTNFSDNTCFVRASHMRALTGMNQLLTGCALEEGMRKFYLETKILELLDRLISEYSDGRFSHSFHRRFWQFFFFFGQISAEASFPVPFLFKC